MNTLPSGIVTFLFTDIEGSTKLAQEFPDTLQAALDVHHKILRDAIESNNGFVFEIVGDAFCAAFDNTQDAVNAAVNAQVNLANEKWQDAVIKVRMGIHRGNAEWSGKRYMGYITLARTARVMSAAYGGQVLISDDAYKQLIERENLSFRDLGERRLKDVIQPIRLFQITASGLEEDFPPLKTLDARPNNLPVQLTSFIGREEEIKQVKELLKQTHLLTLTGSGGAGKTRLALQAGADIIDDFANGVWLVELAPISDPMLLPQTLLNALGLKEEPKKTLEQTLIDYLKDKEILIILDNCEHLIQSCADLTEKLLSTCPKLKIIATSREALNCSGEQTYRIPVLSHPEPNSNDTPEQLTQYESVRLFIERALVVNPKFRVNNNNAPALAEICSRLDGVPLAIELAAARIKVLSVEKIYERLDDRFNLLTGGKRTSLPRQQTLRALIDWSYDLLTDNEKTLWSRLSVFTGGWTLEAAEEICSDETINKNEILDLLSGLTEKSIVIYDETKERYRILETIKQYGREKLTDEKEILLKHLNYYKKLAEEADAELKGNDPKLWLDILEAEHSNLQSAIEWCIGNEERENAAKVATALVQFWNIRGHYTTGIKYLEIILINPDEFNKSIKAKALKAMGIFNWSQGEYENAKKFYKESLAISKEIGDKDGVADSLMNLGAVAHDLRDYENAKKFLEESLAIGIEIGDKLGIAISLNNLGNVEFSQGEYENAKKFYKESLAISKEIGVKRRIAMSLGSLGNVEYYRGEYENATKFNEESLVIHKEIGDKKGIAFCLNILGNVEYYQGEYVNAKKFNEESLVIYKEIGDKKGIAHCLNSLGSVFCHQGEYENAKKFFEECLAIYKDIGDRQGIAMSLINLGKVFWYQGEHENAKRFFEDSLAIGKEIGDKKGVAFCLNSLGSVFCHQGEYENAKKFYEESLAVTKEIGDKRGIVNSLNTFGNLAHENREYENAVRFFSVSEKILKSMGAVLDKEESEIKDKTLISLHEQLSDEEFNKYWEEGKKLTLDEAVELALKR